jgi:hypothetical protein
MAGQGYWTASRQAAGRLFMARLRKDRARLTARGGSVVAQALCVRKCAQ